MYDRCVINDSDLEFEASLGIMITGQIDKNIEKFELKLKRQLPGSDHKNLEELKTYNLKGKNFSIGPFKNNETYVIELFKESYEFMQVEETDKEGNLHFRLSSLEISSIVVNVVNKDDGAPISGVSLYVTSTDKGNNQKYYVQTNNEGIIRKNLLMGQYFVKAVLKEYSFEPSQQIINLSEGQNLKLTLKAKRVAFSVLGSVIFHNFYNIRLKCLVLERLMIWMLKLSATKLMSTEIGIQNRLQLNRTTTF